MPDRPRPRGRSARAWLVALGRRIAVDRIHGMAAEVSFFGMLSLFPGMLVAASVLGDLEHIIGPDLAQQSRDAVITFLHTMMTDRGAPVVDAVRELFDEGGRGLLTTAAVLSFWTMSSGFMTVISALDRVYGVPERRPWLLRRLTSIVLALGTVVMLAVMLGLLVLGPLLGIGRLIAERLGLSGVYAFVWEWARAPAAFMLVILWAAVLYRIGPSGVRTWRQCLPGAVVAGVLWLAGSYGLRLYSWMMAEANRVVSTVAAGLILMIWLFILSFVLLLGAEINDLLSRRRS